MHTADFDTLNCSTCDAPVPPSSVSAGPVVAYRCACGTSWRINATGEQTHLRLSEAAEAKLTDRLLGRA